MSGVQIPLSLIVNFMINNFFFFFFSNSLLISALMVIIVQNSVYSVLFLVLSFISATGLLCLLECEFIALIFIIIYVGAIAILFLFVVMMLNLKSKFITKDFLKYFPIGSIIGLIFLVEIAAVCLKFFKSNPYGIFSDFYLNDYTNWYEKSDLFTELESIGQILYTYYVFQFLIAGFILLLSVVGSVVLSLQMTSTDTKTQLVFKQVSRSYKGVLLY